MPRASLLRRSVPVPALVPDRTELHQARQVLITRGLVAYQRPLYQVLALDATPSGATPNAAPVAAEDEPVDLRAVFARSGRCWHDRLSPLLPDQTLA